MAKDESVAIERLVLDVGGKKVELTVDQAKRLHGVLAELFADKTRVERHEYHHHDIYRRPWSWLYDDTSYKCESGVTAKFDASNHTLSCKV